jgi:hypothetical protein
LLCCSSVVRWLIASFIRPLRHTNYTTLYLGIVALFLRALAIGW